MADGPLRVLGRYALYGEIAAGGMATVHFGRLLGPVGFSRTVAIKRLHPQFAKDPEFVSMFLDEARVAARIQHPNVVATLDVVALEGELFLVMEYLEGESLARLLRTMRAQNTTLPHRIVGSIVTNLLFGLHAAHEARSERGEPLGLIHRDVSPQNVLVGVDGVARVLDFGVAKAAGRVQTTRDGQIKGKLAYMPIEQIAGEDIDRRVDVYAAGVVAWEALTARRLFDGPNEGAILHQVMTGQIVRPSQLVPNLPPGVDDVIMKALSREPQHRFDTAYDFAVALEETLGQETPRRVASFVVACAGDAIARRAAQVNEIESMPTDVESLGGAALVAAVAAEARGRPPPSFGGASGENSSLSKVSSVSVSASGFPPQRRRSAAAIAVGAAFVVGALVAAFLFWRSRGDAGAVAVANPQSSVAVAAPPVAAPSATPAAESSTVAIAEPPPETSADASSTSKPLAGTVRRRPTTTATATPPATTAAPPPTTAPTPAKPKTSCNPPYYFEGGIRKIKPECLSE